MTMRTTVRQTTPYWVTLICLLKDPAAYSISTLVADPFLLLIHFYRPRSLIRLLNTSLNVLNLNSHLTTLLNWCSDISSPSLVHPVLSGIMAPGALLNEDEVFSARAGVHGFTPPETYPVVRMPWNALLHRDLRNLPLTLMEADGVWLKVTKGSEYWEVLDGSGGAAVSNIGHKDLRVMQAQIDHFLATGIAYATSASFQTEITHKFAYFLLESTNFQMARVVFYSSGMYHPIGKILAYQIVQAQKGWKRCKSSRYSITYRKSSILNLRGPCLSLATALTTEQH
jgi:hypothetical protein